MQGATQAISRLLEGQVMLSTAGEVGPGAGLLSTTAVMKPSRCTGATSTCMVALQALTQRPAHQELPTYRTMREASSKQYMLSFDCLLFWKLVTCCFIFK